MPQWYEKYGELLDKCKKRSRCNTIHLWFEETNARMQARMMSLKTQKNRTRLSSKQCI